MLQFNLKAVMSEQKKTITWLSDKTGISRKTFSQMVNNETKGIQFSTLEAVMSALNIEVDDLIARATISAILSVLADDSSLTITEGKFFSTAIFLELIQLSGGNLEADETAGNYPVLGVAATITDRGSMLITISSPYAERFAKNPEDEKLRVLVGNVDEFIKFLKLCSENTQQEISANIVAALLRHVQRAGGDISKLVENVPTPVLWQTSRLGEEALTIVNGQSYLPPDKHLILKLNPYKEVSIVNCPLDSIL
ncbi:helix-turn-helix family protein [Lacticaseibacillus paracasei subsp. paracasei Lpp126]|uniref:Helix-turn-helix family protein n=1 Tax=Lacticaseibacillus paracasei subsp. paracasei Lpp126 TaxID=1256206 RepID=S2SU48_LACPA|nr:helix-turn-helix family protein [Lacticaseibacillus paracasei subsp. paracasei Lpp126]